jgi:hypothetical protein
LSKEPKLLADFRNPQTVLKTSVSPACIIQSEIEHNKPHVSVYKEDDGTFLMRETSQYGDAIPGKPFIKITKEKAAAMGFYTD